VCVEDLDIAKMTKRPEAQKDPETGKFLSNGATQKSGLSRSIYDAGWGTFVIILKGVASKLGKRVVVVPPQYTSQICSECLEIVEKSLSTRTHKCPCGYVADRDHNAAKNILRLGLESLGFS
jgi:putative transposase